MGGKTSGTIAPDLLKGRHFDREIIVPLLEVCTKPTDAKWGRRSTTIRKVQQSRRAVKVCNLSLGRKRVGSTKEVNRRDFIGTGIAGVAALGGANLMASTFPRAKSADAIALLSASAASQVERGCQVRNRSYSDIHAATQHVPS